ncbi:reverse transcriptase family protein [Flavobacterium granuli]|uniref:RNA-directed DNA polymerase n=1 Tax=Flavobacterium granuli TaxID=280093 RepID=A0ABU1S3Q2_9FLAO|nr:reverse transcriptase family protein [Flavobacterium granuli]MDR6845669.1 5'-3' exonuclease [Flavobacterium granuli]
MKDKSDFLALLNYVKPLIYGEKTYFFTVNNLNYHINNYKIDKYESFKIKKKSGKDRIIHAPNSVLKSFQKCLNIVFQAVYKSHPSATGFVIGKSIVDNAKVHIGSNYVFNIDLKDFFPSIDQARFWGRLQHPPFNLNNENGNLQLANIIAHLCCHKLEVKRFVDNEWKTVEKNVLPQGAPTSPVISNIICHRLDFYLSAVAKKFGAKFTRYADDITFSSVHNIYNENHPFILEIHRIITNENFVINSKKTRLQEITYKQVVTGLVVNENVNVSKKYIKELRMWLFFWETYGLIKASVKFKSYRQKQGIEGAFKMVSVIKGKLDFLKMVKGANNLTYLKLLKRYEELVSANSNLQINLNKQKRIENFTIENFNLQQKAMHHQPQKLVALLSNFTAGSNLKYATHSWEEHELYDEFIDKLILDWKKIEKELFQLKKTFAAKIDMFLDSDKVEDIGWGSMHKNERIYFGWKSKSLVKWCHDNPEKSPFYFPIPENRKVSFDGIQTNYFYNITEIFKRQIEIREENNHLHNLFMELRKNHLGYDFKLIPVNTKGITFFTDVNTLRNAIVKIFEGIKKRPQFPKVKIVVEHLERSIEIRIIHVDSICNRPIHDNKILFANTGDFADLNKYFNNLCDWSIESNFSDGKSYRINYIDSKTGVDKISVVNKCEGFTFLLRFYL